MARKPERKGRGASYTAERAAYDGNSLDFITENTADAPMFRQSRKKNDKKKTLIITLCCILVAALLAGLIILAIKLFGGLGYDHTSEFYFTSDLLTEEGGSFADSGKISFELYNYADALRTSIYDIESFDVEIEKNGRDVTSQCGIEKSADSMSRNERAAVSVTVTLPEGYDGEPVDVKVTSHPTEIVLRGTFTVVPKWSYSLESEENSIVATLVLSCDDGGVFDVKWDKDEIVADNNDPAVASSDRKNSCEVVMGEAGSYELRFFKNDVSKTYSGSGEDLPVSVAFSDGGDEK